MPAQYNGLPANISRPAATNISGSTNASPIRITCAAAHNLTSGDRVLVVGHLVNTAANGVWTVTVLSATDFHLGSLSTGNGVGGATGTAQGQGLLPTFQQISDGDARNAASVNVATGAGGDRTAWLAERVGSHRLVKRVFVNPANTTEPASDLTTWAQTTYAAGAFSVISFSGFGIVAGDIVAFRSQLSLRFPNNVNPCFVKVQRDIGAGVADISNNPRIEFTGIAASNLYLSMPLNFEETMAANTSATGYNVYVIARNATTGGTVGLLSNSTFELCVWRPNP